MFDVYLITEEAPPEHIATQVERALLPPVPAGVGLQLRQKRLPPRELRALADRLRALTRERGVRLIINGDLTLARNIGADGVHLPDGRPIAPARHALGPTAILGASCHDAESLRRCAAEGASFATLSPVFPVAGKAPPLGVERFGALAAQVPLPVLALGGIDDTSARALLEAGARGIAVTRAVFAAAEPAAALQALGQLVSRQRETTATATRRDTMQ